MGRKTHRKISKKASMFIARNIKKQLDEGKSQAQAVAIAYSKARARGYKVPKKR